MDPPPSMQWRTASAPPAWSPATGHVWRIDLHGESQTLAAWRAYLSPDEAARADRFTSPRESRRFIVARGALRAILARYLGVAPADLRFEYGPAGKPRLAGPPDVPRFNLSHCEDAALVAVSPDVDVGVDLERVRFRAAALDIAERYWTPEELAACRFVRAQIRPEAESSAAAPTGATPYLQRSSAEKPPAGTAAPSPLPSSGAIEAKWEANSSVQLAASLVRRPEGATFPLYGGVGACQAARGLVQAFSSSSLSTANDPPAAGTLVGEGDSSRNGTTADIPSGGEGSWTEAAFDAFWTRIWARKEALLKGLGGGMFLPMERISVWPPGGEPTWRSEDGDVRRLPWRLLELQPSPQDRACVAWEGDERKWIQLEFAPTDGRGSPRSIRFP